MELPALLGLRCQHPMFPERKEILINAWDERLWASGFDEVNCRLIVFADVGFFMDDLVRMRVMRFLKVEDLLSLVPFFSSPFKD